MAGVLNFALGLESNTFLKGMQAATLQLASLNTVASAVRAVFAGIAGAIEKGGALADLAAETRTTVGEIYQLQEAFKVIGAGAESVAPMIQKLRRELGGTVDAERLQAIAQTLSELPADEAAKNAFEIGGREGANTLLKIAGSMQDFRDALADSAQEAAVFQRASKVFDEIGDKAGRIKGRIGGIFASIAEQLAPSILAAQGEILKALNAVFGSVQSGRFGELIKESLLMGIEMAVELSGPLFQKMGVQLAKGLLVGFRLEQALRQFGVEKVAGMIDGGQGRSFSDIFKATGENPLFKSLDDFLAENSKTINSELQPKLDEFKERWKTLFGGFSVNGTSVAAAGKTAAEILQGKGDKAGKANVTDIERIGFIFDNSGRGRGDYARRTMDFTKQTADNTRRILERLPASPTVAQSFRNR